MTINRNLSLFAQGTFASGGVSIGNTTDPGAGNLSVTGNTLATGGIKSGSGTVSAPTATATTLFTVTAAGIYNVFCYISGFDANSWAAQAIVTYTGGSIAKIVANNSSLFTLTLSGNAIQATQISGSTYTLNYVYERII